MYDIGIHARLHHSNTVIKQVSAMCNVQFSLVPSPLPQNGCRRLEDCLGNCVHLVGAVTCHSQNLECPIRLSEIMTMSDNYCTALTEETLALVDLATVSHLPLSGPCNVLQM